MTRFPGAAIGWISLLMLFVAGCDAVSEKLADNTVKSGNQVQLQIPENIRLLNPSDLQRIISDRRQRPLLINVWATWCIPCREEFPDLIKLQEKYGSEILDMVAISVDYPDEIDNKIKPFLEKLPVNFPIYVQNFDRQEDFINTFSSEWSDALPATFLYDGTGKQRIFHQGQLDFKDLENLIRPVLK